ncbi:MAG: hypothetical protein AAGA60_18360 [Cyanobacteria bacterium P01_E01_bin.42]
MRKKKEKPKEIILDSPNRRPYAAKIRVLLQNGYTLPVSDEVCLCIDDSQSIVRISPLEKNKPYFPTSSQKLDIFVEGYSTAREAEQRGLKLSLSVLWAAISRNFSLRLEYHTPLPCVVFDRTQENSQSFLIAMGANISVVLGIESVVKRINEIFSDPTEVDQKLLVSMEIFASARLESTERSRFIGLVSSIEPLITYQEYNNLELETLINSFVSQAKKTLLPDNIRPSIMGRIKDLNKESIRQAIKRFVKEKLPENPEAIAIVDDAYNIRSKILHEGSFDADLNSKSAELEEIMRQIYASILGLNL